MPIDYKKYPKDWKTKIRPDILNRSKNCCEFCGVENYKIILRGKWQGLEVYQDENGDIYNADNSILIDSYYLGEVDPEGKNKLIKVVLTIAHIDHNIHNNDYSNLRALCQRCHNRHDKKYRKKTRELKKNQLKLNLK